MEKSPIKFYPPCLFLFLFILFLPACFVPLNQYRDVLVEKENIRQELNFSRQEKSQLEAKIAELQREKNDLGVKVNSFKETTSRKMGSLEEEVESLRKSFELQLEEEKSKNNQLEELNVEGHKEILRLKQENFGLLAANKAQADRSQNSEKKINSLELEIKNKADKIIDLEKEVEVYREAKKNQEKEVNELIEKMKVMTRKESRDINKLTDYYNKLIKEFDQEIKSGGMSIIQIDDELFIQMMEELIFDLKNEEIKAEGEKILVRIGSVLTRIDSEQIRVEGHFEGWETSAKRAGKVMKFFEEKIKINPRNLLALGLSSSRPIAGVDKNNRVEIVIAPKR